MGKAFASVPERLEARVSKGKSGYVWTPSDFADLGGRDTVDKALQRLEAAGKLEKVARGLYQRPSHNPITGKNNPPDPSQVLAALERRDATPMLIDGMSAANELGFTTAVPAKIVVHTNARRASIALRGGQKIIFKLTAPSKLFWAGRPAMRLVQALLWLNETQGEETEKLRARVRAYLADPRHRRVRTDLREGFNGLPTAWLRELLRPIVVSIKSET
jgi:hypothetical protein